MQTRTQRTHSHTHARTLCSECVNNKSSCNNNSNKQRKRDGDSGGMMGKGGLGGVVEET